MKLDLNNKYSVTTDKHNYILQEKRLPNENHHFTKNTNTVKYIDLGYFKTLNHLARYLIENEIKIDFSNDFRMLNERLDELEMSIVKQIEKGANNHDKN